MQPLPAGTLLEEVVEETPAQPESEPKELDPEEDLLCIAKTFSYLRESGESEEGGRSCPGKFDGGSTALPLDSSLEARLCPEKSDGRGTAVPRKC